MAAYFVLNVFLLYSSSKVEVKESPPTSPEDTVISKATVKEERTEREFKS